jgi:putative ABC transport system substrate-binding protein
VRKLYLVIIGIILFGSTTARARDLLVVQGLHVKPFDEAFRGFRSVCSADARRIYLPDLDKASIPRIVREERPRLIIAIGADALAGARKVRGVPVLYLMVLNPHLDAAGSTNVSGVTMNVPPEKYFDHLMRISPATKTVGLVYDPAKTGHLVKRAQQAARSRGIELTALEVRRANDVPKALGSLKGMVDALLMLPDTTVVTPETVEFFLLFSQNNNIPVITFASKYVEMGALLSLDIDAYDQGKQAGEMALQILNGATASDLPEAEARKVKVNTNRSVARKLGITLGNLDR